MKKIHVIDDVTLVIGKHFGIHAHGLVEELLCLLFIVNEVGGQFAINHIDDSLFLLGSLEASNMRMN
jgi:hypothetical protein